MRILNNLEDIMGKQIYIDKTEFHNDGGKTVFYTAYLANGDIELDSFNYSELSMIIEEGRRNKTTGRKIINW